MIYTSILLIFLISFILMINHWNQNKGIVFLVFGILFSSIRLITFLLINIQSDYDVLAFIFLHTDPLICLIAPAFLFYLRSLIYHKTEFHPTMLFHFLPAFLVLINTLPYFAIPYETKLKFVEILLVEPNANFDYFPHFLFSYKFQKIIPPFINVSYFIFYLIYGFKLKNEGNVYIKKRASLLINRIMTIIGINILPAVLLVAYATYHASLHENEFTFAFTNIAYKNNQYFFLLTLVFPVSFFLSPSMLYGEGDSRNKLDHFYDGLKVLLNSESGGGSKTITKSDDLDRIIFFIEDSKPYLQNNFSLHDISRAINIPLVRVTNCFNKQLKISFPIYRNRLRVQHATSMLRDGAHLHISIEGIAMKSGFKSASTFYMAFKAEYGMTPIEWIKQNL